MRGEVGGAGLLFSGLALLGSFFPHSLTTKLLLMFFSGAVLVYALTWREHKDE